MSSRDGPQKPQMRFIQREHCVNQKNPRWIPRSHRNRLINSIQHGHLKMFSRKQCLRTKYETTASIDTLVLARLRRFQEKWADRSQCAPREITLPAAKRFQMAAPSGDV